jgi:6-pyruvoyltetrahydropterin/6-carboxytetrahydropterin synthase
MMLEVSQEFYFEAAHTLVRDHETDSSRRFHGHTYNAEVTVRGEQDPRTGMVIDLAVLRAHIDLIKQMLDHRNLNEIDGLSTPTLENLAVFIAHRAQELEPRVAAVRVWRSASGDGCFLRLRPGKS